MERLFKSPPDVIDRCIAVWTTALQEVERSIGPIANISNDGRRKIAARLRSGARSSFELDVGRGYGLFFASAQLEASALPGDDAGVVLDMTNKLFAEGNEDLARNERKLLRDAIATARLAGATNAREAAETAMGRTLSEAEWESVRDKWEIGWEHVTHL
jgi:hypothetical protein